MSRLNEKYTSEIRQALQEKFQYKNVMEIPKIGKSRYQYWCWRCSW